MNNYYRFICCLAAVIFSIPQIGCGAVTAQKIRTIQYYKEGFSTAQLHKDHRACGGKIKDGLPFYDDESLPLLDACMRGKNYNLNPGSKLQWSKNGVTPAEEKRDLVACGGFLHQVTGQAMVRSEVLPAADKCMRSKGYQTNACLSGTCPIE